jgi:hypothetical protein
LWAALRTNDAAVAWLVIAIKPVDALTMAMVVAMVCLSVMEGPPPVDVSQTFVPHS